MSYSVYRVSYIGAPRDHHAFFVETNEDGPETGFIYQVTGDIQNGMTYGHKKGRKPEESASFVGKKYLGIVTVANYPLIEEICNGIAPPKKQYHGAKKLYPHEPIRRCQEWNREALQALISAGVLQPGDTGADAGADAGAGTKAGTGAGIGADAGADAGILDLV